MMSPSDAITLTKRYLEALEGLGECVIEGSDLEDFTKAAQFAKSYCELQPSVESCRLVEECLSIMANNFLESPNLKLKPSYQVQFILDCFEEAGGACHEAGRTIEH